MTAAVATVGSLASGRIVASTSVEAAMTFYVALSAPNMTTCKKMSAGELLAVDSVV
jgi:hypothetical protein